MATTLRKALSYYQVPGLALLTVTTGMSRLCLDTVVRDSMISCRRLLTVTHVHVTWYMTRTEHAACSMTIEVSDTLFRIRVKEQCRQSYPLYFGRANIRILNFTRLRLTQISPHAAVCQLCASPY